MMMPSFSHVVDGASLMRIPAFAKVAPNAMVTANVIVVIALFIFLFS
jgi:hypothetical protein